MKLAGPSVEEPEISLTALIDVVFTLIIFFVVTTTFDERAQLSVDLPRAGEPTAQVDQDPLVIVVNREGRYFIGPNEVLGTDSETLMAAIGEAAGEDRSRRVVLRADAQAQHQSVVTAMDALGRLGFSNLSIATIPEGAQ
jgi:biopolymer transport protein ExbD